MRVVVGWIIAGTLLALTVLGAVSSQDTPETATWMVISVAVAAGLGALITAAGSAPARPAEGDYCLQPCEPRCRSRRAWSRS